MSLQGARGSWFHRHDRVDKVPPLKLPQSQGIVRAEGTYGRGETRLLATNLGANGAPRCINAAKKTGS